MDREIDRMVPLDELSGYEVARGEHDVRGWDVIAGDGRRIGEVDELLVDMAARKVRYLDVAVDEALVPDAEAQRILIPVDSARVSPGEDRVFVDGLRSGDVLPGEPRRDERRDERDEERRDDGEGRQGEPQRADAPIVERERAIVPLDPPTR